MTYRERYHKCMLWYEKISIMSILHLSMCNQVKDWRIVDTAKYFGVSKGLVSENLKLSKLMHKYPQLEKCYSRQNALRTSKNLLAKLKTISELGE